MNWPACTAAVLFAALRFQLAAPARAAGETDDADASSSELRGRIERFCADRGEEFRQASHDGKVDYILFRNSLRHDLQRLAHHPASSPVSIV
jgi:hypothetical protein